MSALELLVLYIVLPFVGGVALGSGLYYLLYRLTR